MLICDYADINTIDRQNDHLFLFASFHVATRKFQMRHAACVLFLLDEAVPKDTVLCGELEFSTFLFT
jgi:hypothetical protein